MTDRKLIVLTIVIISLFAISAVNAADNVTADVVGVENQSVDVICDMDDNLTISQEGLSKNSQDENDLNMSDSMDNIVLEKNNGSEKKSESPLYGIVDIGANSMELGIFKIKDNGKPKATIKSNVLKNLKVGKKVSYQAMYLKDIVKKTAIIKK